MITRTKQERLLIAVGNMFVENWSTTEIGHVVGVELVSDPKHGFDFTGERSSLNQVLYATSGVVKKELTTIEYTGVPTIGGESDG